MKHETLWTVKEVAELFRMSELTVYKYIWNDSIPSVRIGKKHFIHGRVINEILQGVRIIEPAPNRAAARR